MFSSGDYRVVPNLRRNGSDFSFENAVDARACLLVFACLSDCTVPPSLLAEPLIGPSPHRRVMQPEEVNH